MTNFPRFNTSTNTPSKCGRSNCTRCGGGGVVPPWGTCFRCGGCGADPTEREWLYPSSWTDEQCQAHADKREAQNVARSEKAAAKRRSKGDALHVSNVEACPALARLDDADFRGHFDGFILDLWFKSRKYSLSEKQLACVTKAVESKDAYLARKAGWEAKKVEERANAKPIPAGRVDIEGTVLSIKEYSFRASYNNDVTSLKALIQCDGYKLFGTLPASIVAEAKVGDKVRLTATVKEKEAGFGTYSRPTGGEILLPVSA